MAEPKCKLLILCDTSFKFVFLIENYFNPNTSPLGKSYEKVALNSYLFSPPQLKLSITIKDFFRAFDTHEQNIC